MTNRMIVKVVKETKKASLVQNKLGEKAWFQTRWVKVEDNGDLTVNKKSFEKNKETTAMFEQIKSDEKEYSNKFHPVKIKHQTEKAIMTTVDFCLNDGKPRSRNIWIPKSPKIIGDIKDNVATVKGWLLNKKCDEIGEQYRPYNSSVMIESIGGY